jgi:hypothetical protein
MPPVHKRLHIHLDTTRSLHLKQTIWVLQKKGEVKEVEEEEDVPEYEL